MRLLSEEGQGTSGGMKRAPKWVDRGKIELIAILLSSTLFQIVSIEIQKFSKMSD